jgi:hypothetical protein
VVTEVLQAEHIGELARLRGQSYDLLNEFSSTCLKLTRPLLPQYLGASRILAYGVDE